MKTTLLTAAIAATVLTFVACEPSGADDSSAKSQSASPKTSSSAATGAASEEKKSATPAHAGTIAVDQSNFEEVVLKSEQLVLVDYGAEWCGPCKIVAPIVEEIAEDYEGQVVVATLDVDVAGDIATSYGVQTLPTLMVFKDGKPVDTVPMNRLPTKADIARVLDEHL